jgi:hypothetical protein
MSCGTKRRLDDAGHAALRIEHRQRRAWSTCSGRPGAPAAGGTFMKTMRQAAREASSAGTSPVAASVSRWKACAYSPMRSRVSRSGSTDTNSTRGRVDPAALPTASAPRQFGQRGRAHVRAVGEAEEDDRPVALQFARHQARAVGLLQREGGQRARLREQARRLRLRHRGVGGGEPAMPGPQADAAASGDHEDPGGGAVEHASDPSRAPWGAGMIPGALSCTAPRPRPSPRQRAHDRRARHDHRPDPLRREPFQTRPA